MKTSLRELLVNILGPDFRYPVGSYYETSDANFDPNIAWGGTWVQDSKGRVLVAYDEDVTAFNQVGKTGGNKDAIVPYHRHSVKAVDTDVGYTNFLRVVGTVGTIVASNHIDGHGGGSYTDVSNTSNFPGGNHSHNVPAHDTEYVGSNGNTTDANLQPYTVAYRWHRTA